MNRHLVRALVTLCGGALLSLAVPAQPAAAYPPVVTLTAAYADGSTNGSRQTVLLTATADISPYPYRIDIFDLTVNRLLAYCETTARVCTASASALGMSGNHDYIATVSRYYATYPPPDIQSQSNLAHVFWWSTSITATPTRQLVGMPVALTAVTNKDVGATPYYLDVVDLESGLVNSCYSGSTCSHTAQEVLPTCRWFQARVTDYAGFSDQSGWVEVCWGLIIASPAKTRLGSGHFET